MTNLRLFDPLAKLLGMPEDGILEYSFMDAVKLSGHACPTVAGAYLMTVKGVQALYPEGLPKRGGVKVYFRDGQNDGVVGVMSRVAGLITGACGDDGFKGLAGQQARRGLLFFNAKIKGEIAFERVDTKARVEVFYNPGIVPGNPQMGELLGLILQGVASEAEEKLFAGFWQKRVSLILGEYVNHPELVRVV